MKRRRTHRRSKRRKYIKRLAAEVGLPFWIYRGGSRWTITHIDPREL